MAVSKTDIAYNYIKNQIISGKLPPMSDISEDELQQSLSISRTPIREALIRLQTEHFIEILPRKGIVVSPITYDHLNELFDVRITCEPFMFIAASKKLPDPLIAKYRDRFMTPPCSPEENASDYIAYYSSLDYEMQNLFLEQAGNRFMTRFLNQIFEHNQRLCFLSLSVESLLGGITDDHIEILTYMLEHNPDKIEKKVKEHLQRSKNLAYMNFLDYEQQN